MAGNRKRMNAGAAARTRAKEALKRARELREADAFEPPVQTGSVVDVVSVKADMRASRRKALLAGAGCLVALIVVALVGLCMPFSNLEHALGAYSPSDALAYWWTKIYTDIGGIFSMEISSRAARTWVEFAAAHPNVDTAGLALRGKVTLVVIACGCMLAVSGLLFQSTFRNPIATPSLLGVSDGVTLGSVLFVMTGNYSLSQDSSLYFLLVYGCGALVVLVVVLSGRFISGRRSNVVDMLLAGTVIAQLVGGVNTYVTNFVLNQDAWGAFYEMQQAYDSLTQDITYWLVGVFFVVTVIPAVLLSFRLNLVSFDDGEVRLSGAHPVALRALALVLGAAMQLAAMASIGQVAMLGLVIPFLTRYILPSDFRWQLLGNCLLGSAVLLLCVNAQSLFTFGIVSMPIGTIVGVLVIPLLVWVIALQRKGWE